MLNNEIDAIITKGLPFVYTNQIKDFGKDCCIKSNTIIPIIINVEPV